jgi:hypothetical protein
MVAVNTHATVPLSLEKLQAGFLAVMPRIDKAAHFHFRHLTCPGRRADAVAEVVAVAWSWYRRCAERGRDAGEFPSALARLAARFVRSGRRLCGQESARDALSERARRRHGFAVAPLPDDRGVEGTDYGEALHENMRSPVPEQVCFRLDFPRWLRRQRPRDRRVARALMAGERTTDVAQKFGLTLGRVSQLRRDFREDWEAFCGTAIVAA